MFTSLNKMKSGKLYHEICFYRNKIKPNVSFDKAKASFAFHENTSDNKWLIGQDREHLSDMRDKGGLTFKLLTILNALFIPVKICGISQ